MNAERATREDLQVRRDELAARLQAIRRDLAAGLASDLEDQAQQLENQETLLEIARVTEQELLAVEDRLRALDDAGSD